MNIGDTVKYNASENCLIIAIDGNNALVKFKNGFQLCTRLSGLTEIPHDEKKEVIIKRTAIETILRTP